MDGTTVCYNSELTATLARKDARFFATLDLENEVCDGVRLAVGIRNSFDKSFPIGFCCGERVMVCDNLSFGSEVIIRSPARSAEVQRCNHSPSFFFR
jgi:hypothetical protein